MKARKRKKTDAKHFLGFAAKNLKTVSVGPRTFRLHGLLGSTGWDRAIDHAGSHQQDDELSNINNEKLAQTINGQPMSERLHSWSTWLDIYQTQAKLL